MTSLFRDLHGAPRNARAAWPASAPSTDCTWAIAKYLVRRARARELDAEATVVSFDPLPREFFARGDKPPRLMLPRAKFEGLRDLGVDAVGLLRFDAKLAAMPAQRLRRANCWSNACACARSGSAPGFRFGHARGGDLALLQRIGADAGFAAHAIEPVLLAAKRYRARASAPRSPPAISTSPNACSGGATPSAGTWCAAASSGARSASRPRTCASAARPGIARHLRDAGARDRRRADALGVELSARARPWTASSRCSRRTCSISTATCTGAGIEVEFVAKLRDEERFPTWTRWWNRCASTRPAREILQQRPDCELPRERRQDQQGRRENPTRRRSCCRKPRSRCAATCPSASRTRWRAGKRKACTRASACTPPGARASCCTTDRRTRTARSTSATRSTRS